MYGGKNIVGVTSDTQKMYLHITVSPKQDSVTILEMGLPSIKNLVLSLSPALTEKYDSAGLQSLK